MRGVKEKIIIIIGALRASERLQLLLMVILLLPLFMLNILDSHDWGGDFAQYIQQAINIAQGKSQNNTHYIFNPEHPNLGPPTYPVGFPLLLSPVYAIFGNSIMAFSYYISFILVLFLTLVFKFLKNYFDYGIAMVATLVLAYNPWTISFKGEVLSDIPFALFLTLALLFYVNRKKAKNINKRAVLIGLLVGFSMLIKSIGFILIVGMIAEWLVEGVRLRQKHKKWDLEQGGKFAGVSLISCLSLYIVFSSFLFPSNHESYSFFSSLFSIDGLGDTLLKTTSYYIGVFEKFFNVDNGEWRFVPLLTKAFALVFCLLGLFLRCIEKPDIKEYIIVLFFGIIFCFPSVTQGFRYLLPLFSVMLYHLIYGLQSVRLSPKVNRHYIVLFVAIVMGFQYKRGINKILDEPIVLNGPQHPSSKELFNFIIENTPDTALFVFRKPRVLGLYTGRDSYSNDVQELTSTTEYQLSKLGFGYLLVSTEIKNFPLKDYIDAHLSELDLVFKNEKLSLYKKKTKG